jgi:hypothetical protein
MIFLKMRQVGMHIEKGMKKKNHIFGLNGLKNNIFSKIHFYHFAKLL